MRLKVTISVGDPVWGTGNQGAWQGLWRGAGASMLLTYRATTGLCWRMKAMVQSGMAGASPATTMIRMRRLAKPYHGSGTPCGCHAGAMRDCITSVIRQQSPQAAQEKGDPIVTS